MLLLPDPLKVTALVLLVELPVRLKRVCILAGGIEGCGQRLSQVLYESLQVAVIVKHGGQARPLAARLLLKLVVDDGPT